MATQDEPSKFDEVDWAAVRADESRELSTNLLVLVGGLLPIVAIYAYDALFVGQFQATFGFIGWQYDATDLDFLFAGTLVLFFSYAVLPLYQKPRRTRYYWQEFKKNRPALVGLAWVIFIFVVGLLGPLFISPPQVELFAKYQPPVFLSIPNNFPINCVGSVSDGMCQGSWQYPLGTTQTGESIAKIIIYGMQVSMKIAFITTLIVISIGTAVGTVAAYAGGIVDEVLMRYVDFQQSFPTFIFYLLILFIVGPSLALFIIVFALFAWEGTARYVRSKALSEVEEEYIKAAKLSGASTAKVVRRHVIPNSASSILTQVSLLVPGFILFEAQLSFLGLGSGDPTWGRLIANGRSDLAFAPWITLLPGIVLFLTILSFTLMFYAMLDAINPETAAEGEG